MGEWLWKFVINRLLYMVLLIVLCLGIFPFCTLFPFTMWIGKTWDRFLPKTKLESKVEMVWDIIGRPYDALVKLVG
jgi:hypothetical protein